MIAGRLGERDGVGQDLVVDLDAPHELSGLPDLPYLHDGLDLFKGPPLDLGAHDPQLSAGPWIAHTRRHHEAVELPLRQGVRTVELVRVLGRYHEERLWQGSC